MHVIGELGELVERIVQESEERAGAKGFVPPEA